MISNTKRNFVCSPPPRGSSQLHNIACIYKVGGFPPNAVMWLQLPLISIEASNLLLQQQKKVVKFHLSWKIFIVLESKTLCNTQLLLKAKWEKEIWSNRRTCGILKALDAALRVEHYPLFKQTHPTYIHFFHHSSAFQNSFLPNVFVY